MYIYIIYNICIYIICIYIYIYVYIYMYIYLYISHMISYKIHFPSTAAQLDLLQAQLFRTDLARTMSGELNASKSDR